MADRVLITGASGFVGAHVAAELGSAGLVLHGLGRGPGPGTWPGEWCRVDLEDAAGTRAAVRAVRPAWIVHLALPGTRALLEAAGTARVLVAGSAAEYGPAPTPIREDAPLRPVTSYGEAKAEQSRIAAGFPVAYARTFNLVGPGLPDRLAPGAFARQIAEAEAGLGPPVVRTGNLASSRDYVDVRDVARAYRLLLQGGATGTFNVCSGRPVVTRDLLELLLAQARLPLEVDERASGDDPADVREHYGDPARIGDAVGWTPEIPLERSLADLLESWRGLIRGTARP